MRFLQDFASEALAQLWADAFLALGIDSTVRSRADGGHSVLVHDDEQMDAARRVFAELERGPESPEFERLVALGRQKRDEQQRSGARRNPPIIHMRSRLEQRQRIGTVTLALIAVSILVGVITLLGNSLSTLHYFTINDFGFRGVPVLHSRGLESVLHGQIWRLLSPIFVHFGVLHLVFNLWWLADFGTAVERFFSHIYLLLLVLTIGILSNLAQYWWTGSPLFGGMSGVIYGLLGFLWVRGRLDPNCPLKMPTSTALLLLLWYVACLVGLVGYVANGAHTAGLLLGGVWGFVSSGFLRRTLHR